MSPPGRSEDTRAYSDKVDRLLEAVASLRTAQELHRSDSLDKHIQNRDDIHRLRGDVQTFIEKLSTLKEDIREVMAEEKNDMRDKFEIVAGEIRSAALEHAETKWVPRVIQAVIMAVILAILNAVVTNVMFVVKH